jgi:hypothetical protein
MATIFFCLFFVLTFDPLDRFECRVGLGDTRIICEYLDLRIEVTILDPLGENHEVYDIRITNVHGNLLNVEAILSYLDKVDQIVILGAGWDTRPYNLVQKQGVHVFEVDAAETQAQKREVLDKAKTDLSKVICATDDFEKGSWLDALKRVGFDSKKPTFILWEGVTFYLEADAVEAPLQTKATQLTKGSAIAFDYPAKHIIDGDASLFHRPVVRMSKVVGEGRTFGIPTLTPTKEQLASSQEQNGLTLTKYEPIGKGD